MRDIFSVPNDDALLRGKNDNLELLKAWVGTSIAFAISQVNGQIFNEVFIWLLLIASLTCGIGFLLHELAHRVVARGYGAEAHFVANNGWLLISIVLAFTGFFIAAPGAVWHRGYLTMRQGGLIALAGPATNLVLALIFLLLQIVLPSNLITVPIGDFRSLDLLSITLSVGFGINAWLGLFNMIPFGPFDGAKVLAWDWRVFAVTVAIGLLLTFGLRGI